MKKVFLKFLKPKKDKIDIWKETGENKYQYCITLDVENLLIILE